MPRPRTPTALLKLKGSWHAKERGDEPQPELGCPEMPADFSDEEREVWERTTATLAGLGLLATSDWAVVERYSRMLCRWRRCEQVIKAEGLTYRTEGGRNGPQVRTRPEAVEARNLAVELRTIETSLGLSPAARSRLSITPKTDGIANRKSIHDFKIG